MAQVIDTLRCWLTVEKQLQRRIIPARRAFTVCLSTLMQLDKLILEPCNSHFLKARYYGEYNVVLEPYVGIRMKHIDEAQEE